MKLKLIGALVLAAATGASFGTQISVGNLANTNPGIDLPVYDNAGALVTSGNLTVRVGNFGAGVPDLALTSFVPFTATSGTNDFDIGLGATDFFSLTFQQASGVSGDFIGSPIFVVMESAGGVAVWQGPTVLADSPAGLEGQTAVKVAVGEGTLVVGNLIAGGTVATGLPGAGFGFTNGIQLAIPEPSVSLLAGLAGLGLLVRRKR